MDEAAQAIETRKDGERTFHDHLCGDLANDPHYTSNKKFYCIAQSNRDHVRRWLVERCRGKRVLDYCCGTGGETFWLAEAGARVQGIDISPVSIEIARREAQARGIADQIRFLVRDAEQTDFAHDYFDLVVVSGVLHHLDLRKAYRELARITKPQGEVICTEALRHNFFIHLYRKHTPHLRSSWETDHILGREEIELAQEYFHEVRVRRFFHLATIGAVPFRNSALFSPLLKTLEFADSIFLRLPSIKWQAWMAVFLLSYPKKG